MEAEGSIIASMVSRTKNDNESQSQSERCLDYDSDGEHRNRGAEACNKEGQGSDPLAVSMVSLQSIQEALEKEIQIFEEIGRGAVSAFNNFGIEDFDFDDPTIIEHKHKREVHIGGKQENCHQPQAVQSTRLLNEAASLKHKLEEVSVLTKAKEHQITELESIANQSSIHTSESLKKKRKEMENELEAFFKEKIELEIEYLIMVKTTQASNVTFEDQISLFEEQKCLASEQVQMMQKLKDAECKALVLKNRAEKLEASCKELLATEEILKMQNRFYLRTLYLTAQIVLLLIVLLVFIFRPRPSEIVPT